MDSHSWAGSRLGASRLTAGAIVKVANAKAAQSAARVHRMLFIWGTQAVRLPHHLWWRDSWRWGCCRRGGDGSATPLPHVHVNRAQGPGSELVVFWHTRPRGQNLVEKRL